MKKVILAAMVAAVSAASHAGFTLSGAGPYRSDAAIGGANNGHFTGTNASYTGLIGSVTMTGSLTTGGVGSWLTEANFNVKDTATSAALTVQPFASGTTWTGTSSANRTVSTLMWATAGQNFDVETYESVNDSGIDATWNNVSLTFNDFAGTINNYGSYAPGTFSFDTEGSTSTADTEIAIYSMSGVRLAQDDDTGTGNLSLISGLSLGMGDYYVLAGGFNSTFNNYGASAGTASVASLNVRVNGGSVFTGAHAASTFTIGVIHVVPEPGTMAALGLGAVALMRRRRSK